MSIAISVRCRYIVVVDERAKCTEKTLEDIVAERKGTGGRRADVAVETIEGVRGRVMAACLGSWLNAWAQGSWRHAWAHGAMPGLMAPCLGSGLMAECLGSWSRLAPNSSGLGSVEPRCARTWCRHRQSATPGQDQGWKSGPVGYMSSTRVTNCQALGQESSGFGSDMNCKG